MPAAVFTEEQCCAQEYIIIPTQRPEDVQDWLGQHMEKVRRKAVPVSTKQAQVRIRGL